MTTLNLAAIMDAITNTLVAQKVVTAANAFAYPAESWTPPCVVVAYPAQPINLDLTAKRGGLEMVFPVRIICGRAIDLSARNTLSALLDGGAATVKTALESGGGTLGGVVASTWVKDVLIEPMMQAADQTVYIAAHFDVEVLV